MVDTSNKFIVQCSRPSSRSKKYELKFSFNKELIDCIKLLDKKDRSYSNKVWTLNVNGLYHLIKMFRGSDKIHFDFGSQEEREYIKEQFDKVRQEIKETKEKLETLKKNKKFWVKMKNEYEQNYQKYSDQAHSGLLDHIKLYPHQIVGILFLKEVKNALLALDMGTGKSLISIGYVELMNYKRVLILTPNSLKYNYYNEVKKFTNSKAHVVGWNKNECDINEAKYIITNYEYFNSSDKNRAKEKYDKLHISKNLDSIICDECQKLKNTKSNIYKNFNKFFGKRNISKVFMSGTPMNNRVYELYTILNQISPIEFSTKKDFFEKYCGMVYNIYGYGWEKDGDIDFDGLYNKISPFMYRKRKEEVLDDLPEKEYINIDIELNNKQKKKYEDLKKSSYSDFLDIEHKLNPLTILINLRKYLGEIKYGEINNLIDLFLENNEKVVIIDVFKDGLNQIYEKYKDIAVLHTGDYSPEERAEMVNMFQNNDNTKIFLGTVATSNFGLTLTAANKMILLTMPYTVGEYKQVVDRIYRIGQKNNVKIYAPLVKNTIDIDIFNMVMSKMNEVTYMLDNRKIDVDYKLLDINDVLINHIKE